MSLILPTKRLSEPRSLLGMGAVILDELSTPKDLSRLWEDIKRAYTETDRFSKGPQTFTFEWFILALDFLYILETISIEDGKIFKLKENVSSLRTPVPNTS